MISVLLRGDRSLDKTITVGGVPPANDPNYITDDLWKTIVKFHRSLRLEIPAVDASLTARRLLQTMIERYRMVGSEVFLDEAKHAPVTFTFAVRAKRGYFRSELKQAIDAVLTSDEGGFFEPGRLGFGEYLYASDLIAAIVAVEGVEAACLNRFKRVGSAWPDRTADEFISVADDELILCMNHPIDPTLGTYRLIIDGGELA
jgi:hypothetical protein